MSSGGWGDARGVIGSVDNERCDARTTTQDAHSTELDIGDRRRSPPLDGHGGKEVAMYAAKHLHLALKETEAYGKGDLARGLEESFLALDRKMLTKEAAAELRKGLGRAEKAARTRPILLVAPRNRGDSAKR